MLILTTLIFFSQDMSVNFKNVNFRNANFFLTGPVCEVCRKSSKNNQNLNRHVREI